jgi:MFS family permease
MSQIVSGFGDSLHRITLLWLVTQITGSALATGAIVIAATLSVLLFSLPAGVIADRYDRKKLMVVLDIIRALLVLLIPVLAAFELLDIAALVLITFLLTGLSQFFFPAENALLPNLLKDEDLAAANALSFASRTLMNIVGPTISGILVAQLGPLFAFYIDSATFAFSAICITAIRLETVQGSAVQRPQQSFWAETIEGIRYITSTPVLKAIVGLGLVATFAFGPFLPLAPIFVQEILKGGAAEYGILSSGGALGIFLGTLLVGQIAGSTKKGHLLIIGYIGMGITTFLFAISSSVHWAFICNMLRSGFNAPIINAFITLLQKQAPDNKRGRVLAIAGMLPEVSRPVGIALGSSLTEILGIRVVLGITATIFLSCGFIGAWVRDLRRAG